MMKKTGAGILWFGMGLFLSGAWGTTTSAQEMPAVAVPEPQEPAVVAESPFRAQVNQRLASLESADLAALKTAKEECEKTAKELAVKAPELRMASRKAYEEARVNSDVAKEIRRQIAELEQKLDQTLRDLPEVKDKLEEIQRVEQAMLVELQVRTALAGRIAAREQDAAAAAPE